jgi:hypothetical protein
VKGESGESKKRKQCDSHKTFKKLQQAATSNIWRPLSKRNMIFPKKGNCDLGGLTGYQRAVEREPDFTEGFSIAN